MTSYSYLAAKARCKNGKKLQTAASEKVILSEYHHSNAYQHSGEDRLKLFNVSFHFNEVISIFLSSFPSS